MTTKFDFSEGALFDPGFVGHLNAFIPTIEYLYSDIYSVKNFNQKKMKFKMYYNRLHNLINTYIGFYLGCILWAACIKDMNKPVLNNLCYSSEYNEEETIGEVQFIKSYLPQFEKDVKYYLGQNYKIDSLKLRILDEYEEFLKANKGFVNVKDTSDIKINDDAKSLTKTEIETTLDKIAQVVETGDFDILYQLHDNLFATTV